MMIAESAAAAATSVIIAALALAADAAFGDPPTRYHPTAWAGRMMAAMVPFVTRMRTAATQRAGGAAVVSVVACTAAVLTHLAAHHAFALSGALGLASATVLSVCLCAVLLKTTVAMRGMGRHAMAVAGALERGDLDSARAGLAMITKRSTSDLDREHVVSGVIESIGENTVDGVTGPLFYYGLLGLPGAFAYRAVNTADSMMGYKNRIFANVGWFAARCDTVLNLAPSRLTALVMVVSAAALGRDWRSSYRMMIRDGGKTPSANAGYPMAALAGALGTRLEKVGHYRLGDGGDDLGVGHIRSAVSVMRLTSVMFLGMVVAPITVAVSAAGWAWPQWGPGLLEWMPGA